MAGRKIHHEVRWFSYNIPIFHVHVPWKPSLSAMISLSIPIKTYLDLHFSMGISQWPMWPPRSVPWTSALCHRSRRLAATTQYSFLKEITHFRKQESWSYGEFFWIRVVPIYINWCPGTRSLSYDCWICLLLSEPDEVRMWVLWGLL
jgi:hypothetical protein